MKLKKKIEVLKIKIFKKKLFQSIGFNLIYTSNLGS